jgi:hypothetical protein
LARSTGDLYRIVTALQEKGVGFRVLDDPAVNTSSRTGQLVLGLLALMAEFETEIRRERQMEGIARAKAEGRVGGRPKKVTPDLEKRILKLRRDGSSIRSVAAEVGLSKAGLGQQSGSSGVHTDDAILVRHRSIGAAHMQSPNSNLSSSPARTKLQALSALTTKHHKAVHAIEIGIFFLMILLQLYGADLLFSWRGWAIAMFGALFGFSVMLCFGAPTSRPMSN